jgi:hypothetical protein
LLHSRRVECRGNTGPRRTLEDFKEAFRGNDE